MRPQVQRLQVAGPVGPIELALEIPELAPSTPPAGLALIGHPHPLYGGALENKVTVTLARAFLALGWVAARPNFRGVGASAGVHDHGDGETADFLHLVEAVPRLPACAGLFDAPAGPPPLALAGFSFGSFVAARAAQALAARGRAVQALVLVGTAAGKWPMPPVDPGALIIHGEVDDTIPLAHVLDWARPLGLPVIVLPGADHFFHRRLTDLKRIVLQNLLGAAQLANGPERGDD